MNTKKIGYGLAQFRSFYLVSFFKGFSKASRATGVSQPALSTAVRKLEKDLSAQLIHRTSTEFNLTAEGKLLLEYCQEFEDKWSSLLGRIRASPEDSTRRLRIGTAISIGYSPVSQFLKSKALKQGKIEAAIRAAGSYELVQELQAGTIDFAFLPDDVFGSDLHIEPLGEDEIVLINSRNVQISTGKNWKAALRLCTLINYPAETPMRSLVDRLLIREGLEFNSELSVSGVEAIQLMVREGMGCAFVLRSLVQDEIQNGGVKVVRLPFAAPKRGITIAVRKTDLQAKRLVKLYATLI